MKLLKFSKLISHRYTVVGIIAIVVTSYISFFLVALNAGFTENFVAVWLRSWSIAFLLAVPSLLFVAPRIKYFFSNFKE